MPLEGPVLEAPGRSLFGLSGVLTVGSSRCLHSHAEALRVRGGAGGSRGAQSWAVPAGGGGRAISLPWKKKGGFGESPPQDHLTLPSLPPGEMYKLHTEIPVHSGLPAGGEAGLCTIPSLLYLLSLLPRCPPLGPALLAQAWGPGRAWAARLPW